MEKKTIRQKVVVSATPIEVYQAFMDAKKHSAFTGSKATCDAKVGGKFTASDGYISGKNLELEEGKRIVQEWVTTEWHINSLLILPLAAYRKFPQKPPTCQSDSAHVPSPYQTSVSKPPF